MSDRVDWHSQTATTVAAQLDSDVHRGLIAGQAAARLIRDGRNEIGAARPVTVLALLAGQFRSVVIWVLVGAAAVSVAIGEVLDGIAIFAIVGLNALVGFLQEHRAERAVAALARLVAPKATVVRDGTARSVPAAEVVAGDVLLLEAGDLIAADARVVEAHGLQTAEAPLTGESEPVAKDDAVRPRETGLADRANMLYQGTSVATGTGRAVVVATGMQTEVGRIAGLLATAGRDQTPLQRQLDQVGRRLLWGCLVVVVLVFALGVWRALPPFEMFMTAVSLAVAAIPEGLPAVVTLALALGVQRMTRRNALIRRLASVETLGCTQVICTDKTGTLTLGEMTVRKIVTARQVFVATADGIAADTGATGGGSPADDADMRELLLAAAACNDAELHDDGRTVHVTGDPSEAALLVAARTIGIGRAQIERELPRLGTVPFDSNRKRMTVVRRRDGGPWAFVKGAPEEVLARCTHTLEDGAVRPLSAERHAAALAVCAGLAADALRVLALAGRQLDQFPAADADVERELTLLGLVGLQDPPRPEARRAVDRCHQAGIRVVMITGDHADTARAVARELDIITSAEQVTTGGGLDAMSDAELAGRVDAIAVYARVTAEHKLRVVRAWKARGMVVAMTGDGVNDAAALKEASIGIAMGISGTEVTREAADMVIADDNFASIVAAVEEGRGIYDNIAKTLAYLLAGNVGELAVMFVAVLIGWPMPLLPIHLLWINLITDGLPALALATEPIDRHLLTQPPRDPGVELANRGFLLRTIVTGCLTAAVTLTAFATTLGSGGVDVARNAAFTVIVFEELLRSFGARSATRTVWQLGVLTNPRLLIVVAVSFALQIALQHVGLLRAVFGTQPASPATYLVWLGLAAIPCSAIEIRKLLRVGGSG